MTYDDWKTRSDRDDAPEPDPMWWCDTCGHRDGHCDCPCCFDDQALTPAEIAEERSIQRGEEEMQEAPFRGRS